VNEKDKLLKIIEGSKADSTVKDLAKSCIESAYSAGFQEGMKRGSEIMSKTFGMIFDRKAGVK
jgi:hypothetical protein